MWAGSLNTYKIIVFGSYVSGIIRKWSDLDLVVVMPSTRSGKEWFKEIYYRIDASAPADKKMKEEEDE